MIDMTTATASRRARTAPARRLAVAATAALLVGGLAACGDDDSPAQVGSLAAIEVRPSTSAAASPEGTPSGTSSPAAPSPGTSTGTPSALGATVMDAGAELEVEDQSGDGTGVRVEQVRLSNGSGHLAVQTRDGQVLGSAPVTSGSQPVTIALAPPVTGSGELLAVLHLDDGDGAFDPTADPVVVDEDGERESEDFDYRVR